MALYEDGTEVEITIHGMVKNSSPLDTHKGTQRVVDARGFSHWVYVDSAQVEVICPPREEVHPGQVWVTEDGIWFARVSRRDLPLRMTPQDMSSEGGNLQTLRVNDFFVAYPKAVLSYDPAYSRGPLASAPTKYVPGKAASMDGCSLAQPHQHANGR